MMWPRQRTTIRTLGSVQRRYFRRIVVPAVLTVVAGMPFIAASVNAANNADQRIDYAKQVKPILKERCYACHGALKQESGLRLDTAASAIKGGDGGPAITAAKADTSPLIRRITSRDDSVRMPPEGEPLKPQEIAAIQKWINEGAVAPNDEQPERSPRDHWSFKTPVRPTVPDVRREWVRNPIDAFVAQTHQTRGLIPQKLADKRTWLRRVTLDLTGLPPTLEEQNAFQNDSTSDAEQTVVNRLLESPQYGERWGRHFMDIWRYSDWWGLGAEVRNSQKHIWHWRDWIIESLNADKGYDQMLREMLAADELYPNDLDRLRGAGFLARQYFKFNRTSWLDETIEHTAKSMLGLTFNCAKCHDHKYDPFSQEEYYRLRAIFEPYQVRTDAVPGEIDFEKDGIPRPFDCNLETATYRHVRGDDRNPDKSRSLEASIPAFLSLGDFKIEPVTLPPEAVLPGLRPFVVEAHLKVAAKKIEEARAAVEAARKKLTESEAVAKREAELAKAKSDSPKPDTTSPTANDETAVRKPLVKEDFAAARPDVWEQREGMWSYKDGKLIQSQVGATRTALRLKPLPPANFEARLKYIPTGGQMWKSVGMTFDVTADNKEVLAYLSSYAGGSKSQVAYKSGGDYAYPPEGAQARPIELNKPHELILRVRGTLVNVIVDGDHSIAYRLPIERRPGPLEIITYDAQAEFVAFELSELPASTNLIEAKSGPTKPADGPMTVEQATLALKIAEQSLAVAELQPVSIRARTAADRARHLGLNPDGTPLVPNESDSAARIAKEKEYASLAARSERQIAAAVAQENLLKAELELLRSTPEKKGEAEKKRDAAKGAVGAAVKGVEMPGEAYASLPGSLKTLESNLESEESRRKSFPNTSTGRRAALARWITDPKHPLPARVIVNHLWARHFGRGLVPTLFDFGRKGTPPSHPELLDWLAVELVDHGWSLKHIHRLIVTSNTYRLSSSNADAATENRTIDPDNHFYWRRNPVRIEAQVVRDALLHLSGELDLTRGGPSIPVGNENSKRRSLYYVHSHNEHNKFLATFDDANVLECYRRADSIVPQQALALENSALANTSAEKIAQRLSGLNGAVTDADFVRNAFLLILTTEPSEAERTTASEALARLTELATGQKRPNPALFARTNLVQALLNHNDFVMVR